MKFQSFREIVAWQRARMLTREIYSIFGNIRDFGFKDQIQRSSVSVMANIAEGYGRGSNKEFVRFLEIAKGSLYETQSLIDIAQDLGYLTNNKHHELNSLCDDITKVLFGLIRKLKVMQKQV
ncbi:MAG: four helix bundle protein [Patescibacteria group bacterium]